MSASNQSLKLYVNTPFIKPEVFTKNIQALERMGHCVINEWDYTLRSDIKSDLESIKNADVLIFDVTKFPAFCVEKWLYSELVLELNKEVWVISDDPINSCVSFKDWTALYSELHPI